MYRGELVSTKNQNPYHINWLEIFPGEKLLFHHLLSPDKSVRTDAFNILWSIWGDETEVGRPQYKMRLEATNALRRRGCRLAYDIITEVIHEGWKAFLISISTKQITLSGESVRIVSRDGEKFKLFEPGITYSLIWKGVDKAIQRMGRESTQDKLRVSSFSLEDLETSPEMKKAVGEYDQMGLPSDAELTTHEFLMMRIMAQVSCEVLHQIKPGEMPKYCIMWFFFIGHLLM